MQDNIWIRNVFGIKNHTSKLVLWELKLIVQL